MPLDITNLDRQHELEREMRTLGISRYREHRAKCLANKDETSTTPGFKLLEGAITPMTQAIEAFIQEANEKGRGRRHTAVKYLMQLEPDTIAFLTAKRIIDTISSQVAIQSLAIKIGRSVEDEIWFRAFAEEKPHLWKALTDTMKAEQVGSNLRQARARRAAKKYEVAHQEWDEQEALHVGIKLLDLFVASTGMVEVVTLSGGRVTEDKMVVVPTETTTAWMQEAHAANEILSPLYLPMLVPPKKWTTPFNGGYLLPEPHGRRSLVKTRNKAFLEELSNTDMPGVYEAVNTLQDTAWAINAPVLDVIGELWKQQSQIGKLPSVRDDEVPPFPEGGDKEAVARWRKMTRAIKEGNGRRRSKRIAMAKAIWVAEKFREEAAIYFPYYLDFRGRAYPKPVFLTPQGSDPVKAMLHFAEAKPLGEQGACWLAIHGANCWGYDKVDLQARIAWVEENQEKILASAEAPLDHLWWADADKPFCFLAFCFEWAGFNREGFGYKSRLPIALDGSCNGLQNFSMALRDEVGGSAVNLVAADKPQDIYQRVANRVLEKLQVIVNDEREEGDRVLMAHAWITSGLVSRKLCKKPVMTLPYGAKQYGMRGGVVEFLEEQMDEGKTVPWERDNLFPASTFVVGLIWQSITEVVVSARQAMDWLQHAAQLAASEGLPVHWHTPDGFPVLQAYKTVVSKKVKTQLGGSVLFLNIGSDGPVLDKRRQASGISPNWVHSLDANHMRTTVRYCVTNNVRSLAMIHDSYATHACDTDMLAECLRAAFVEQYQTDVIEEFRSKIADQLSPENLPKLQPCPPKGTLDTKAVLNSEFFFA